jgi:transposase
VVVPALSSTTRWRCAQCGNLTRFDVVRSSRVREFVHFDLAGKPRVEETEVLEERIQQVRCRWCASTDSIEVVQRVDSAIGPGVDGA